MRLNDIMFLHSIPVRIIHGMIYMIYAICTLLYVARGNNKNQSLVHRGANSAGEIAHPNKTVEASNVW